MRTRILGVLGATLVVLLYFFMGPGRPAPANSPDSSASSCGPDESRPRYSTTFADFQGPDPEADRREATAKDAEGWPEQEPSAQPKPPSRPSPRSRPLAAHAEVLFRHLDRNGDGVLDPREMPLALRAELDRWDLSIDGMIDRQEFLNYFTARAGTFPTISTADSLPAWFNDLDTGNGGSAARDEWLATGGPVEEFRALGRDGDSLDTPGEAPSLPARATRLIRQTGAAQARLSDSGQGGVLRTPSTANRAGTSAKAALAQPKPPRTAAKQLETNRARAAASRSPAPARSAKAPRPKPVHAPVSAAFDFPRVPATQASPLDCGAPPFWIEQNRLNDLQLLEGGRINVLFLGDSITAGLAYGPGKPVWNSYFARLDSDNFAISGLTTSEVFWQVETGRVALAAPEVVVLMIGTNNLGQDQSPRETAGGIARIVTELQDQLPRTQVLLLGVLPRGQGPLDPVREQIAEVNARIARLADEDQVTFLDMGGDFLQPDGTISPAVMSDFAHPTLLGYELYTAAIWSPLLELLAR